MLFEKIALSTNCISLLKRRFDNVDSTQPVAEYEHFTFLYNYFYPAQTQRKYSTHLVTFYNEVITYCN